MCAARECRSLRCVVRSTLVSDISAIKVHHETVCQCLLWTVQRHLQASDGVCSWSSLNIHTYYFLFFNLCHIICIIKCTQLHIHVYSYRMHRVRQTGGGGDGAMNIERHSEWDIVSSVLIHRVCRGRHAHGNNRKNNLCNAVSTHRGTVRGQTDDKLFIFIFM